MELRRYLRVGTVLFLATAAQALTAVFGVSTLVVPKAASAVTSVPYLINFQGRLTDNSGNALSDGSYNVKFRLMSAPSAGTNLWEGDRVAGASDNRISVVNGLFNIQFGDTTKGDPALSPSLFNTQTNATVYLEVELPTPATAACATNGCAVFTEGAMTPRQPLASSPYAFNADALDGLDSSAFGQLSAIQSWTDTNTFSKSGGAAIVLSGTAAASGSILQIGSALSGGSASGTLFGANTTAAGDLINLQVSSALRLKVDNAGALTTASTITSGAGIGASGDLTFTQGAGRNITVAQAASGAGNSLTLTAGQSGTGAVNGGDLILKAGATGGSGTSGSVKILVNGADTTSAFQVQNAGSAPAFTIDTVANKIVVGDATGTNAATSLLVIDTATADPATGYNGAMYYNSTSAAFRCYQGGAWTNCITSTVTATSNSQQSFLSGLQNVAASSTGAAVEMLVFTASTTVSNVAGVTGFTAPAAGYFRSCLVKNNAAITAGTLGLRWRVNGVSVGASACNMSSTINRQAASTLDNGVVAFNAGDTIGIAFDTNAAFLPTGTNDFTVFWDVEYKSSSGNGLTLQFVYDSSNSPAGITLANSKDLVVTAADTAVDPNFLINLACTTCSAGAGRFAVQNGGTDAFVVNPNNAGITLGQSTTVSAGKSLTLASGAGSLNQTFTNTAASSAQSIGVANTNTGAGVAIQGIDLTPTNTSTATSGSNTLNLLNFNAGGALGGTDVTNGLNFASVTGYTNFLKTPNTTLAANGDLTTTFTQLNGTSTTNGAGTASTSLTLTSPTNFDIGNYVQVNDTNCGGTGVNPCYAKITNIVGNVLTITPALTWTTGKTVNEYHLPEIGGTDTAQTLANRYGRGYFISGVAAGNGTTYYNEDSITTSLSSFTLLNDAGLTNLTIGNSGTTLAIPGNLNVTGNVTAPSSGTAGYWNRSGTTLQPANSGDGLTTSGTVDAGAFKVSGVAGGNATCTGGQMLQNPTLVNGILTGGTCAIPSGTGAATNLSNLAATSINQSLVANANNSLDLGSAGTVWANLFTGNVDAGTTTTTLTIGTAATTTALTLGRTGLAASIPGGLSTSGSNITTSNGTINTGSGSITTTGSIGGGAITGTSLSSSGGNVTAGAGTISGAVLNATTKFQLNGTDGTASTCSAGAALTGATFAGGILTAAGSCTTFQAAGSYIVQAPAGTANTITAASGAQALILKGTNGTGTHLLDIYNTAAVPILTSYFDQNGALTTTASITAPTSGSINGLSINAGALSGVTGITLSSGNVNAGTGTITGNGSGLTNLPAGQLTGALPAISGASLTSLNPSNLSQGTGAVTLQSAAATSLTLDAAGGTILLGTNTTTIQKAAAALAIDLATAGTSTLTIKNSNSTNVANLAVTGNIDAGAGKLFTVGGTQISSANLSNDANITKQGNTFNGNTQLVQTTAGGALPALSGTNLTALNPTNLATGSGAVTLASTTSALTLTSGSGTIILGSNTIQRAAAGLTLDISNAGTSTLTVSNTNGANVANLSVDGGVGIGTGQVYTVGATNGATVSACTSGQYQASQAVIGGIVSAGTCTTADLQNAYANSTAPATINLNTTAKDFVINATDQATDPNILFNLQCATCSAGGGRFAVQDTGVDIFTVNPGGSTVINPTAGSNLSVTLAATSSVNISSATAPTVDQVAIDNTAGAGVTTAGVNGLSVKYKGGAAAIEASGMRVDFTPGTTTGGTWSGLRIVDTAAPVTGVNTYGLKLEGPGTTACLTAVPPTCAESAVRVASGWDIGVDIQSGGIQLADMSADPSTPAAGQLRVYSRLVSGRSMLSAKGSSGVSYALQPSFAQQNIYLVTPGSSTSGTATTLSTTGGYYTLTGNAPTAPATATEANGLFSAFSTTTTAGNVAGFNSPTNEYYRGSVTNGADGFFFFTRIVLNDATLANYTSTTTGVRMFYGLSDQTGAVMAASASPTGNYSGFSFVANRAGESGIMQFMTRDGTTETHSATGVTLASGKTYDLYFYVKPRDTTIYWRIDNLTDGTTTENSKTTNLPTTTVAMKPMDILTNLSAATRTFGFQRMYVETDR